MELQNNFFWGPIYSGLQYVGQVVVMEFNCHCHRILGTQQGVKDPRLREGTLFSLLPNYESLSTTALEGPVVSTSISSRTLHTYVHTYIYLQYVYICIGICVRAARALLTFLQMKSMGFDLAGTGENLTDTAHDIVLHSFLRILSPPNLLFLPELK